MVQMEVFLRLAIRGSSSRMITQGVKDADHPIPSCLFLFLFSLFSFLLWIATGVRAVLACLLIDDMTSTSLGSLDDTGANHFERLLL